MNLYEGTASAEALREKLKQLSPKKLLLIHGPNSYRICGAEKAYQPVLKEYSVIEFAEFNSLPMIQDVDRLRKLVTSEKVDCILAVGGGTVMDLGKAAALLTQESDESELFITGQQKASGKVIPFLLVPTTSGTGAEITPFAVVYIEKTKHTLAHPALQAEMVILDPSLTQSLSPRLTAQTGSDALAQSIEGFWSVKATEESKNYSREAIPLVLKNLAAAVNAPTLESRAAMQKAAYLSGKSISIAQTTAAHALSYPLTSFHQVQHGHAVIITLPYFFAMLSKANAENIQNTTSLEKVQASTKELCELMGVKTPEQAKQKILDLMVEIGLETKLSDLNIHEKDLENIVDNGFNPQRVVNSPIRITKEMEWEIVRTIL